MSGKRIADIDRGHINPFPKNSYILSCIQHETCFKRSDLKNYLWIKFDTLVERKWHLLYCTSRDGCAVQSSKKYTNEMFSLIATVGSKLPSDCEYKHARILS